MDSAYIILTDLLLKFNKKIQQSSEFLSIKLFVYGDKQNEKKWNYQRTMDTTHNSMHRPLYIYIYIYIYICIYTPHKVTKINK